MNIGSLLKKFHNFYYYSTPAAVWKIINPFLGPVIVGIREDAFDREFHEFSVIRVTGKTKEDGLAFKMTLLGSAIEAAYYSKLLFETVEKKEVLPGKVPFSEIFGAVERERGISDIVILRVSQKRAELLWDSGAHVIPDQVDQEMEIPADFAAVEKRLDKLIKTFPVRHELEKIQLELSAHPGDLKYFYEQMYVPTVKNRFDESGFIYPFEEVELFYRHGALFFIKNDGVRVAAMLLSHEPDRVAAIVVGVLNGDAAILRGGYMGLMYLEALRYARGKGYKKVDFGGSRPYLLDGVLRFKKKIGTMIRLNDNLPVVHGIYLSKSPSAEVAKVLERNPVIVFRKRRLAVISVFSQTNPPLGEVGQALHKSFVSGVEKVILIAPSFNLETKKQFSNNKNVILVEEPDFAVFASRIKGLI